MRKTRTHYDNLKVPRTASAQTIRAAFKRLALKYHPDKNRKSGERANRIMQILNASYAVLNDPVRRAAHDQWLASVEAGQGNAQARAAAQRNEDARAAAARAGAAKARAANWDEDDDPWAGEPVVAGRESLIDWPAVLIRISPVFILVVMLGVARLVLPSPHPGLSERVAPRAPQGFKPPATIAPLEEDPSWQVVERPATAPNGAPWPAQAGELPGYPKLRFGGPCSVTLENLQNPSDVFVRLVTLDLDRRVAVRHIFIPAFGSYTCDSVQTGHYELRYENLASEGLHVSGSFYVIGAMNKADFELDALKVTLFDPEKEERRGAFLDRGL